MTHPLPLAGKRALVTGGNTGIGAGIVRALGHAGARVLVDYVTGKDEADALVDELQRDRIEAAAFRADVSDPAQVAAMFAEMERSWGGIDILVNNAGIQGDEAPAWERDPTDWWRVLEVNLFGSFLCAREASSRMIARRSGTIITITSVHEVVPWSGHSAYNASKAALGMLNKTLAQEAGPYGVRVIAIAPGAIRTDINEDVWSDPAGNADLLTKIPIGRVGTPAEVADMVVVLASDAARYVTGATVFVDGGMFLYPAFMHGG